MEIQQKAWHYFSTLGRCHGRRARPLLAQCFGAIPLRAAERVCNGTTLLQTQVNEHGTSRSDRFRFTLGLDAEYLS